MKSIVRTSLVAIFALGPACGGESSRAPSLPSGGAGASALGASGSQTSAGASGARASTAGSGSGGAARLSDGGSGAVGGLVVTSGGAIGMAGHGAGHAGAQSAGGTASTGTAGVPEVAGGGPSGGDPSAACMAFCSKEGTVCTGANAAYPSLQLCLITCANFAPGDATDTGNTLACRNARLNAVETVGVSQCPQTGPVSKASFDDTTATGMCN